MTPPVTWAQVNRAIAKSDAYQSALNLITRKPIADVVADLERRLQESQAVIAAWKQQGVPK